MSTVTDPRVTVIPDVAEAHYNSEEVPDEVLHPDTGEVVGSTHYERTDGWRGYWEVNPASGWHKVGGGCNCGDWDDAPAGTSTREVAAELTRLADEHGDIVLVLCGGSNLFAMQYDVLAREERS